MILGVSGIKMTKHTATSSPRSGTGNNLPTIESLASFTVLTVLLRCQCLIVVPLLNLGTDSAFIVVLRDLFHAGLCDVSASLILLCPAVLFDVSSFLAASDLTFFWHCHQCRFGFE